MFAGLKKKQISKNKYMSYDDFKAFIYESKIMGPDLADRDINQAYEFAMMTQVTYSQFTSVPSEKGLSREVRATYLLIKKNK